MSGARDSAWIWSDEHGDYYKAVYGTDGRVLRYVWGRATLPPEPQASTSIGSTHTAQYTHTPESPLPHSGSSNNAYYTSSRRGDGGPSTSQPYAHSDHHTDSTARVATGTYTLTDASTNYPARTVATTPRQTDVQSQVPAQQYPQATQYQTTRAPQYQTPQQHPQDTSQYSQGYYGTTPQYSTGRYTHPTQRPPHDPSS